MFSSEPWEDWPKSSAKFLSDLIFSRTQLFSRSSLRGNRHAAEECWNGVSQCSLSSAAGVFRGPSPGAARHSAVRAEKRLNRHRRGNEGNSWSSRCGRGGAVRLRRWDRHGEARGGLVSVPGRWALHKCDSTFCVNLCWGNCLHSIFSMLLAMLHGLLTVVQ